MTRIAKSPAFACAITIVAALVAGSASRATELTPAGTKLQRVSTVNATTAPAVAMVRTSNGALHLVYQTLSGTSPSGLASRTISAAGKVGAESAALSGWQAGQPGLVRLPNGNLEAFFGAVSPKKVAAVWGITSSDGGLTWSAPADVRSGSQNESLAYGSDVTAAMAGTTPVLMLPQAGNLVVQRGIGSGAPTAIVTGSADGSMTDADVAVDASSGAVVAGWQSVAHDPKLFVQSVAPTAGSAAAVPGQSRNAIVLAGRDNGAGVFGAYTTDGKHVRLLRYGGGSVAVGSLTGTSAKVLGVATSLDGRVWVMWGDDSGGGIAVTRSNKAVTRFESIQSVDSDAFSLYRISGDGRLGPLDLLVDQIPSSKGPAVPAGLYYARVLPLLTASASATAVKNKQGTVVAHKLTVTVSDAGDPVSSASVSADGLQKKTNAQGIATLTLPGSAPSSVTITVTSPGYRVLKQDVHI
jgi:hypothetical protein